MNAQQFRQWRIRMGGLSLKETAATLQISFSSARCYGDGTREVPAYIEKLCSVLEAERNAKEIRMAKTTKKEGEKPEVNPASSADISGMMAAAFIQHRAKRSPMAAITMNRDDVAQDMAAVLDVLAAHGVEFHAKTDQAAD